jgi:hypothetical protein
MMMMIIIITIMINHQWEPMSVSWPHKTGNAWRARLRLALASSASTQCSSSILLDIVRSTRVQSAFVRGVVTPGRPHLGNMRCCQGNIWGTFHVMKITFGEHWVSWREHLGNIECHSGNIQCHEGNIQWSEVNIQCHVGNIRGIFGEHSVVSFREHSASFGEQSASFRKCWAWVGEYAR